MPVRYSRIAALILLLLLVITGVDQAASAVGAPPALSDFLTTFLMAGLVATWSAWGPWLAPYLITCSRRDTSGEVARCTALLRDAGVRQVPGFLIVDSPKLVATAMGTRHGLIIVSSTLLSDADDERLQAILLHELGHIEGGHMMATGGVLAAWFMVKLLFPADLAWTCIFFATYLALLRRNEFDADRRAARRVGGAAMVVALEWVHEKLDAPAWTEQRWLSVFSTHPTLADRSRQLLRRVPGGKAA